MHDDVTGWTDYRSMASKKNTSLLGSKSASGVYCVAPRYTKYKLLSFSETGHVYIISLTSDVIVRKLTVNK